MPNKQPEPRLQPEVISAICTVQRAPASKVLSIWGPLEGTTAVKNGDVMEPRKMKGDRSPPPLVEGRWSGFRLIVFRSLLQLSRGIRTSRRKGGKDQEPEKGPTAGDSVDAWTPRSPPDWEILRSIGVGLFLHYYIVRGTINMKSHAEFSDRELSRTAVPARCPGTSEIAGSRT